MWIIPKTLQWSSGAPDTEAYISDSNEQSQICASSLMVRSKLSPARTWLQKWKRDSWSQHLFGRILKPSHAKSFVTEWTSLWPVIPASHLAQQASDSEQKTHATSGHTSGEQLGLFDLESASLKTSRDTSRLDSPQSSAIWKNWVLRCRGAYSARLKSARRISESGCSSWPTVRSVEWKGGCMTTQKCIDREAAKHNLVGVVAKEEQRNWPTATVTDSSAMSPEPRPSRIATGRKTEYLARMVNWPTVTANEDSYRIGGESQQSKCLSAMARRGELNGQPDQANHSTNGSRQELWLTPRANEPDSDPNFAARNGDRGAHCHGTLSSQAKEAWQTPQAQDSKHSGTNPTANGKRDLLVNQVGQMQKDWRTPGASDGEGGVMEMREGCAGKYKLRDHVVAEAKQWGTPTARDHKSGRGNEDRDYKELTPMVERVQAGKLNPRWVETLMGVPIGWVSPDPVTHTTCTNRTDELRLLGNGVVPATAYKAWTTLTGELK